MSTSQLFEVFENKCAAMRRPHDDNVIGGTHVKREPFLVKRDWKRNRRKREIHGFRRCAGCQNQVLRVKHPSSRLELPSLGGRLLKGCDTKGAQVDARKILANERAELIRHVRKARALVVFRIRQEGECCGSPSRNGSKRSNHVGFGNIGHNGAVLGG